MINLETVHRLGFTPLMERTRKRERIREAKVKLSLDTVHGVCASCGGPVRHVFSVKLACNREYCSITCYENSKNKVIL